MQLTFNSISEAVPGPIWQNIFRTHWSAYRTWFESRDNSNRPNLDTSLAMYNRYMPEMIPTFDRLCELAGADDTAVRFLTGYCPPAYITGCSQSVCPKSRQLIRNYDYHPNLCEGTLLHSAWNGKKVIATGDCLYGAVDGMNEDGLAISLTFGGRKVVGRGFGIPFVIRYVLEFCSDIPQVVDALKRIPVNMAYNVTVLDRGGEFKTIQLGPDRAALVTSEPVATNHQGAIEWHEHALFSKTLERERFLRRQLRSESCEAESMVSAFLEPPLFNTKYKDGFGTIYTAVYEPAENRMELRWPGKTLKQSLDRFEDGLTLIHYVDDSQIPETGSADISSPQIAPVASHSNTEYWKQYSEWSNADTTTTLAKAIGRTMLEAMEAAGLEEEYATQICNLFTTDAVARGQIPWEMLADMWSSGNSKKGKDQNPEATSHSNQLSI